VIGAPNTFQVLCNTCQNNPITFTSSNLNSNCEDYFLCVQDDTNPNNTGGVSGYG